MNIGSESSESWARMGDGWTKFDDGSSAKTDSVKYINMDTESTETVSYNVSYPFECDLMYGDPTIKKAYTVYKERKTLKDCEVDILTVEKFNGDDSLGYVAYKETVAIAVSGTSENNNKMKLSGNFNGKSDPIKGKFVPDGKGSGTFTKNSASS